MLLIIYVQFDRSITWLVLQSLEKHIVIVLTRDGMK